MRIKIMSGFEEPMPVLYEVKKVSAEIKGGTFNIRFEGGTLVETPVEATILAPDDECIADAKRTYNSLLTELALNGYTNLCIGEQTCLLDERWRVTEYLF